MPDDDTLHRIQRNDAACDRFEAAWREGSKPRLEDFLASVPADQLEELFADLLAIEIEMRATTTEPATRVALLDRFPTFANAVKVALPLVSNVADETSSALPTAANQPYIELPCRFGNYDLLHLVGKGRSGRVFRGKEVTNRRDAAVKVLDAITKLTPVQRSASQNQLNRAALVQHPNLCPIWEVAEHEGLTCVVMPFLAGLSLADVLQFRVAPFSSTQAQRVIEQLRSALSVAHTRGIAHGNLHPGNVLLSVERGDAILLDLGHAPAAPPADDLKSLAALHKQLHG